MKPVRALLPVALIALAPAVAACGDDDAKATDDVSTSSSSPVDRSTDASTATSADTSAPATVSSSAPTGGSLPAACDVVKKIDIATAYGVTPAAGQPATGGNGTGSTDGDSFEWSTDECSFTAKDFLTATLALAGQDDFQSPFGCPPQTGDVTKVKVKGADQASWSVDTPDPLDATLRVCTDQAVFDITLEFEPGYQHEGDPQAQTISLAETVLGRI